MDTVENLRAFVAVAQAGSFSAAARRTGLAVSVVAKRIDQLEAATGATLFVRTTRTVTLTEAGRRWIVRVQSLVADVDEVMAEPNRAGRDLEGPLRIKAPTTLTVLYLADILARFQKSHPRVSMEVILTDRVLNPIDEGFDLAVAAFGATFSGVVDLPLCPLRRLLCASPGYLASRGIPSHPRELTQHDTLNFQPTGRVWFFDGPQGPSTVTVQPTISANDGQVLLAAARAGNGIALLSEYVVMPAVDRGELTVILEEYPPPEIWVKALIPEARMQVARIRALADFLQASFTPLPPWNRGSPLSPSSGYPAPPSP